MFTKEAEEELGVELYIVLLALLILLLLLLLFDGTMIKGSGLLGSISAAATLA